MKKLLFIGLAAIAVLVCSLVMLGLLIIYGGGGEDPMMPTPKTTGHGYYSFIGFYQAYLTACTLPADLLEVNRPRPRDLVIGFWSDPKTKPLHVGLLVIRDETQIRQLNALAELGEFPLPRVNYWQKILSDREIFNASLIYDRLKDEFLSRGNKSSAFPDETAKDYGLQAAISTRLADSNINWISVQTLADFRRKFSGIFFD